MRGEVALWWDKQRLDALLCLESRWCVTMEILKQCRRSLAGKLHKHKAEKLFSSFLAVFLSSCVTMSDRGETMTAGESRSGGVGGG